MTQCAKMMEATSEPPGTSHQTADLHQYQCVIYNSTSDVTCEQTLSTTYVDHDRNVATYQCTADSLMFGRHAIGAILTHPV